MLKYLEVPMIKKRNNQCCMLNNISVKDDDMFKENSILFHHIIIYENAGNDNNNYASIEKNKHFEEVSNKSGSMGKHDDYIIFEEDEDTLNGELCEGEPTYLAVEGYKDSSLL